MRRFFRWAIDHEKDHRLDILRKVLLFKGLNKKLLRKLVIDLFEKEYAPGETIFAQGDNGIALYIVMEGSVKIVKKGSSDEKILATMRPGTYFGELALINQAPRFASAIAEEKTNLLIMYKSYFDNLIRNNSAISTRILLNLVESISGYICKPQDTGEDTGNLQS